MRSSHKNEKQFTRKSKGRRGQKGVRGETADPGGGIGTGPFPQQLKISIREVWYANPRRIDPFPPRYRTTLTAVMRGAIATGTGPVDYIAYMNSPLLPFAPFSWNSTAPSKASLNATGFSALCNANLYQNFRVLGSRIKVEVAPVADVDVMIVTLTPSAVISSPVTTAAALGQPYTRTKMIQRGQPARDSTLVNKMSVATILGVEPRAIIDDMSGQEFGSYASQPVDLQYWHLNFVREDNNVTNSNIGYIVSIQYDVEFFADGAALNPETARAHFLGLPHPK